MRRMRWALLAAALAAAGPVWAACRPDTAPGVEIYPSASVLPENLLRFYVYFPRPMAEAGIMSHIDLIGPDDAAIEGSFLPNRYDLWSPDRARLTLLLDPGRVKTQLAAHAALGRALVPGEGYRLVVAGAARDAQGCALGADVVQRFAVGPADLLPPDPGQWQITPPAVGSQEALRVRLGSPHDHLSLAFRLRVVDDTGAVVRGRVALGAEEAAWVFEPAAPWQARYYTLRIGEQLEDLAGNRPAGLFDRPAGTPDLSWTSDLPIDLRDPG